MFCFCFLKGILFLYYNFVVSVLFVECLLFRVIMSSHDELLKICQVLEFNSKNLWLQNDTKL